MNHAPRNAVTVTHTNRRRFRLISLGSGPTVAKPPAAAALDVPTAGVPTYLVASPPLAADDFAVSGFGLAESVSGPAMRYLLDSWSSKIIWRRPKRRLFPLQVMGRRKFRNVAKKISIYGRRMETIVRRARIFFRMSRKNYRERTRSLKASEARRIGKV